MRRFIQWLFRIYPDQFRLDVGRVISIDGHEFVVVGFMSMSSYTDTPEITVTFERYTDTVEKRKA